MNRDEFVRLRKQCEENWNREVISAGKPVIWVSLDSGGIYCGSLDTYRAIEQEAKKLGVDILLKPTGAFGTTWLEPVVDIQLPGQPRVLYKHITADKVPELLESTLRRGKHRADLAYANFSDEYFQGIQPLSATDWWRPQHRILLANCGWQDPESLEDYLALGGFSALEKALFEMSQDEIIAEVKSSNLRGRGGAGFPAGIKWESARSERNRPKYVIVNAHEGEPNVFKDRRLIEGDPYAVIEGLMIAAWAVGVNDGYIYVGSEYPLAMERLNRAIRRMHQVGLLGKDILGSGFDFDIKVVPGAGAYISGEASAAIYGIQGQKGFPRTKPPRSAEAGLWGKPTVVNNVETLANVPHIINKGAQWFASIGTENSTGTKVFSLAGDINHVGLVEADMGITMRDLLFVAGGGMRNGAKFKAVLAGGISGGALPESTLDLTNEFGTLEAEGSMMGSGGYIIYDENTCMVDLAFYCTRFNRDESCGKCVPCRIGTSAQLSMLDRIMKGLGEEIDIDRLTQSSEDIIAYSLCGLGQAAPIPVLSVLRHFRDEVEAHIREKRCPAGVCRMTPVRERRVLELIPAEATA